MKLNKIEIPKNIKPFDITEDHIQYCNRCDMLHLAVWFNETALQQQDNYVFLKEKSNCFIIREGIYDVQTSLLSPPFIAMQKYYGLSILQAFKICDMFMSKVNKAMIRDYCNYTYGAVTMPRPPKDILNYVVNDNILYEDPMGLPTLYGILSDVFCIDRDIIENLTQENIITMDPHYNICFNTFDEEGNVVSTLKMSRYRHSNKKFSFNHYVTQRNVGFEYLSEEARKPNSCTAIAIFDNPIEMLSFLTLEKGNKPAVPKLSSNTCLFTMHHGNTASVTGWLSSHSSIKGIYIANRLNEDNHKYIKGRFYYNAKTFGIKDVKELRELLLEYLEIVKAHQNGNFRISGWNDLLKIVKYNMSLRVADLRPWIINNSVETKIYNILK